MVRVLSFYLFDISQNFGEAALGTSTGNTTPTMYSLEPDTFLFKLLCPQSITGFIIGRKGAIINQLNHSTGAKIRLSQNNEFYPGTMDRILLSMHHHCTSISFTLFTFVFL